MSKPAYFRVSVKDAAGIRGTVAHHTGKNVTKGERRGGVGYAAYQMGKNLEREYEMEIAKAPPGKELTVEESRLLTDRGWTRDFAEIERTVNDLDRIEGRYTKSGRSANASRALDVELSLSVHLSQEGRRRVEERVAEAGVARYGGFALTSRHLEKEHNPHAHMLFSRYLYKDGKFGERIKEMDAPHCRPRSIENPADWFRRTAAEITNEELAREGRPERVSHLSYERQGLDIRPREYLSKAEYQKRERNRAVGRDGVARELQRAERELAGIIRDATQKIDTLRKRQWQERDRACVREPGLGNVRDWERDQERAALKMWEAFDRTDAVKRVLRGRERARAPTPEERWELKRERNRRARAERTLERVSVLVMGIGEDERFSTPKARVFG